MIRYNLDNGCYGKNLLLEYNEDGAYYSVTGENRAVTFYLGVDNLFFVDSVHSGSLVVGIPFEVDIEAQVVILEDGTPVRVSNCEYFGRGY